MKALFLVPHLLYYGALSFKTFFMRGESFDLKRQNFDVPKGYVNSHGFLVPESPMDTKPKVTMSGSVGEQMFDRLSCNLIDIKKRPRSIESLEVVLSSFDGDIIYGFSIYNLLKQFGVNNVPIKITEYGATINTISALILQAADKRCMFENQNMLLYPKAKKKAAGFIKEDQEEQERLTENYIDIMKQRIRVHPDVIEGYMEAEELIDSEQAKRWGLVDEILSNTQNQKKSVSFKDSTFS